MISKLFASLVLSLFVLLAVALPSLAGIPCGNYFKSDYRAIDKIRFLRATNVATQGGYFVLADWTNDGRADFYNFQFNVATGVQDVIIYPALATGYWDWDHP